jgi:hypothetical protein
MMNISTMKIREWARRALGAYTLALALIGGMGTAQAQQAPSQAAPPDVAEFLKDTRGHWHVQGTQTADGKTTQITTISDCTAAPGGVATQCVAKGPAADGSSDSLTVYGYDFDLKKIVAAHVDGNGALGTATGTLKAGALELHASLVQDGKPVSFRFVISKTGPNESSLHIIVKVDGKTAADTRLTQTRSP